MKPRSALQQRKIRQAEDAERIEQSLKRVVPIAPLPSPERISEKILSTHSDKLVVRTMKTFNRSLKTKDAGRIRLAIASHLYGKFTVPRHLQEVWWKFNPNHVEPTHEHRWNRNLQPVLSEIERKMREDWYICAATGGSLYKQYAKTFLTKKEVHTFLTCSLDVTFEEAIYYAIAASYTDNHGVRTRIMKSKLMEKPVIIVPNSPSNFDNMVEASVFWRDVIRFFCQNPLPINEMNDILDYISQMRAQVRRINGVEREPWAIKGRSLHSLQESTKQWHRDLTRVKRMGDQKWTGVDIPDALYEDEYHNNQKTDWSFMQIKTSKLLAAEGNKMHHCVYSYQGQCISGRTSIWSLRRRSLKGDDFERAITLEIKNESGEIVQIRGYANRTARNDEMLIIRKWAADNGLAVYRHW